MYYLGIDGGGTKTSFKLYDAEANCIGSKIKPTCHILQISSSEAIDILREGVNELLKLLPSGETLVIGAGLAGYGEDKSVRYKIENVCEKAFHPFEYYLFNDVDIALEGALNGKDGILVIAGTGSIALSKKNESYRRTGGWGYMLGDEGSAYWIAKEIFRHYTFQVDGREDCTQLIEIVKESLELENDYDLISYFANVIKNDRREIAKHAKILEKIIAVNDPVGIKILDELAYQLSRLINTLGNNFSEDVNVSYLGGVFNLGEPLFKRLKHRLSKHLHLIEPKYSPERGAIIKVKKIKLKERNRC